MKSSIILSFLLALFFISCRKEDNPKLPDLIRVPVPLITKDATGDAVISALEPESFAGKFVVDMFFATDTKPQKADVVVIKNDDKTNVKIIQANVTTFPTTVEVTGAQLTTLFGEPIVLGDNFDIGADITTISGQTFQAFPAVGDAYGPGVSAQPGASLTVRYSAVCVYDPEIYQGNFVVIEDEFADLLPGDIVVLTKIDDTHFSYIYPSGINPTPIVVTVDPLSNEVAISKQKFGNAFTWEPTYTNPNAESATDPRNFVAPCAQEWGVVINYSVDQGDFGSYYLKMKKQ